MSWSPVCPHCGAIIWEAVPDLRRVRDFVTRRRSVTSRDVADAFGWSIANASNKLARLVRLGVVLRGGPMPVPAGGREYVFTLLPE
jgi:predicted transcriptional regulator